MPNLLNSSHAGVKSFTITKKTKKSRRKVFILFSNYFSKSSFLISTFAWPADYRNQENHCKGSCFTYACTSQGVKHWLFDSKYRIDVVKLECFKIKWEGSKIFQKGHQRILGCLNISNLVNTKVTKIIIALKCGKWKVLK